MKREFSKRARLLAWLARALKCDGEAGCLLARMYVPREWLDAPTAAELDAQYAQGGAE